MTGEAHAHWTVWLIVLAASLAGALWDVRTGRIPNAITFPLLAAGILCSGLAGGWNALGESLGAALLVALPFLVLYAMGAGGAGDAKLMAALGAWLGLRDGLVTLLAVLGAGAVLGLLYAAARGRLRPVMARIGHSTLFLVLSTAGGRRQLPSLPYQHDAMLPMPYGVSIFAGACAAALGVLTWPW